jgi:hypothetical protein
VLQVAYCCDVVEVVVCGQYGRVVRDGVPGDEDYLIFYRQVQAGLTGATLT